MVRSVAMWPDCTDASTNSSRRLGGRQAPAAASVSSERMKPSPYPASVAQTWKMDA